MINLLPKKNSCKSCKHTYYPSKTSHKELCANCTTFPRVPQKSDFQKKAKLHSKKSPRTANFANRTPESSGILVGECCLCSACGEIFEKVNGFDKHRTGNPENRRCLTPHAMRGKGMVINSYGRWGTCKFELTEQQDTAA